LADVIK